MSLIDDLRSHVFVSKALHGSGVGFIEMHVGQIEKLLELVDAAEYTKGAIMQVLDSGVPIGTELVCAADLLRRTLNKIVES